jgi:AcrR family transcriptional regulator
VKKRKQKNPIKTPIQNRSKETVDAIIEAAAHVLIEDGYDAITTNRIAEVAGVSIGSLYQYFRNKEAIIVQLIERQINREIEMVSGKIDEVAQAPLREAVDQVIRLMSETYQVNPKLKRAILEQIPRVGMFQKVMDSRAMIQSVLTLAFQGREDDLYPFDREMGAFILVQAIDGIIQVVKSERPDYLKDKRFSLELHRLVYGYIAKQGASS